MSKYQPTKRGKTPAVWITAYDYPTSRAAAAAGVDMILVGDSGLMVQYGCASTVTSEASIDTMLLMTRAVRRGAPDTYLVADMPIGSYEPSNEVAIENAIRFIRDGGADAVKLEGGERVAARVRAIADAGISVFGHVGLTPQSVAAIGGYRVQGRSGNQKSRLKADLVALEEAGARAVLVEAIPAGFGSELARLVDLPVYGIGAGPHVDGQLLIFHDVVGLYPDFRPSFAPSWFEKGLRRFSESAGFAGEATTSSLGEGKESLLGLMSSIVLAFADDVRGRVFPGDNYSYDE